MCDQKRVREKLKEMRVLVKAGKERIRTPSPVWAVYLAGETLRSLAKAMEDLESLTREPAPEKDCVPRARKTG